MKILLVEDETKVANFIQKGLNEAGYNVDLADDGSKGLQRALNGKYDLFILDWLLPGLSGVDVCKKLREHNNSSPIMMLTAKDATEDKITGLDSGADDYLTKPFAFDELMARIRSLTRRVKHADTNIIEIAGLKIDLLERKVWRFDEEIHLSNKEYDLLLYFVKRSNKLITRELLAKDIWQITFDTGTNYIDVYVNYLRNKLKVESARPLIFTVRGAGYIFKTDDAENH